MSQTHILVVEDEPEIASLLKDYLENENYLVTILDHGDTVVRFIKNESPDMVLLDLMIPGTDGKVVCREVRKFSDIPIIMITARVDEIDRVIGFELGADDYICKPFSPREVVVRVKAVLRRYYLSEAPETGIVTSGSVTLNTETRKLTVKNSALDLTPNEFKILQVMIKRPETVFTRAQLIEQVQGYNYEGYERTIDFHIKNLRKKIAALMPEHKLIRSVYGIGYQFIPDK